MPKVYPSETDTFLVAEALRQEMGNKITIMGAFAAGNILLPPEAKFPAAISLAFYTVFRDGEGVFQAKLRITDPNGKLITPNLPMGNTTKLASQPMQVSMNFGMFPLAMPGKYKIEIMLDDHIYEKSMSITVSDKPIF